MFLCSCSTICSFFVVAMQTLQVTGLTGAYVRHAHAIGGAVLIVIGFMLLFKTEWLTFAV